MNGMDGMGMETLQTGDLNIQIPHGSQVFG